MEKYRPSANQKYVNAAPLKWYLKKTRDFSVELIENVQEKIVVNIQQQKTAPPNLIFFSHH